MDDCDQAYHYTETLNRIAIANQRNRSRSLEPSLKWCKACEEEIPEARRKAMPGCSRCVACETEFERGRNGR